MCGTLLLLRNTDYDNATESSKHADYFHEAYFVTRPQKAKNGNEEGRRLHYEEKYGERKGLDCQSKTDEANCAGDASNEQSCV